MTAAIQTGRIKLSSQNATAVTTIAMMIPRMSLMGAILPCPGPLHAGFALGIPLGS